MTTDGDNLVLLQPYEQPYALLFDHDYSKEHPVGFIAPQDPSVNSSMTEVAVKAAQWISEGIDWDAKRRAVLYFMGGVNDVQVDLVMSSDPEQQTVTKFKVED